MKIINRLLLVCLVIFSMQVKMYGQSARESLREEQAELKELIQSREYRIKVIATYSKNGKVIPLTSSSTLEIRSDSIFSRLPFYNPAYLSDDRKHEGFVFEAPIEKYEVISKKGNTKVKISTTSKGEKLRITLDILLNGSSKINVNTQNKGSYNYSGELCNSFL